LKKWNEKGQYFTYKNVYKIFYVHQELLEKTNDVYGDEPITILFLHGFPTSSYDYIKIWNQFNDENKMFGNRKVSLLAFDYLGYGFSDKPVDYEYSLFDNADMVERLLMKLDIKSVTLIAHDIGDSVALELLRRDNLKTQNHFKIENCILLNGGIISSIYNPILSQRLLLNDYTGYIFSNYFTKFFVFKYSFSQVFGQLAKPTTTDLLDFYLGIKFNNGNRVLSSTIKYIHERTQYGDVWFNALNETALPIMFIYGPADPINPRELFPQKFRQEIPKAELNILSDLIGHYPQYEDPFTVFSLIKQFLIKQVPVPKQTTTTLPTIINT